MQLKVLFLISCYWCGIHDESSRSEPIANVYVLHVYYGEELDISPVAEQMTLMEAMEVYSVPLLVAQDV